MSLIFQHEIRPGDTIKVTSQGGGVLVERTGTVANRPLSHGVLRTEEQSVLWDAGWAGMYSFDLIDRPKPKLPDLEGVVIVATKVRGVEGRWLASRVDGRWWTLGYAGGFGIHGDHHITEWTLAKGVEA